MVQQMVFAFLSNLALSHDCKGVIQKVSKLLLLLPDIGIDAQENLPSNQDPTGNLHSSFSGINPSRLQNLSSEGLLVVRWLLSLWND